MLGILCKSLWVFILSQAAFAENLRALHPTSLGFEGGGRAPLYSIFVDRVIEEDFLVGLGFGTTPIASSSSLSAALVPVYFNYYFSTFDLFSFFGTVGLTWITNSGDVNGQTATVAALQYGANPFIVQLGVGGEYRFRFGLLTRVAAYGLYSKNVVPWFGVTVGYSF